MNGKGSWRDNVMIERLWRSLKYECVYLHAFADGRELRGDGDHNVLSYLRKGTSADGRSDLIVAIINFASTPHEGYRVGLPFAGGWDEVINTDSPDYGGSGVGNLGHVEAEELPWNGRPASVRLRVPPLGAVFLRPSQD